jgi:hypothetical protein
LKYNQQHDEEFRNLMDVITIKETYFFRELDQMKTLVNEVIPDLRKANPSETIKIWSAGCATGEEAYTIAMLCIEKGYHLESPESKSLLMILARRLFRKPNKECINNHHSEPQMPPISSGFLPLSKTAVIKSAMKRKNPSIFSVSTCLTKVA